MSTLLRAHASLILDGLEELFDAVEPSLKAEIAQEVELLSVKMVDMVNKKLNIAPVAQNG